MAKQVHCDQFRQEQFVPARQVRTLMTVYVANHDQRKANNGLGCAVKDLFSGEEKKLKIAALIKMGVRYPNGKKVKAYALCAGNTYTFVGTPEQPNYGVFIVPRGTKYDYMFDGQPLPPGSCILWDGKKSKVIGYRLFRKMFIMGQNPVSAGQMKGAGRHRQSGAGQQQRFGAGQQSQFGAGQQPNRVVSPSAQRPIGFPPQAQRPVQQPQQVQRPVQNPFQNHGQTQAQHQSQQTGQHQFMAVGRLVHNGELVGLILMDRANQKGNVWLKQCLAYAEKGVIRNVKAVPRNGTKFLSGNGITLESLPYYQV